MKTLLKMKQLSTFILAASLWLPTLGQAANVLIATQPLVNMGTSDVLPNIMFVLDNSGSMGRNFTPDWVDDSPYGTDNTLFRNSAFNTQYYNPNIVYTPAVKFDGTTMGNQPSTGLAVENDVTHTGAAKGGTTNLAGSAEYYAFLPGEHCTTLALTNCVRSNTPTATHKFAAPLRWCNTAAATTLQVPTMPADGVCRSIREGAFTNLRVPSSISTITVSGSNSTSVNSIMVNGRQILSGATSSDNSSNTVAERVRVNINLCTNTLSGACTTTGFSATRSGSVVTIFSKWGDASVPLVPVITKASGTMTVTPTAFATRTPGSMVYVPIAAAGPYTAPGSAAKGLDRTDCAGATCTLAEEMTNYANWHTYYRTRMQAMKSAASLAFKGIGDRYRVGFITIANQGSNYLPIAKFSAGASNQKDKWYQQLYVTTASTGTPLRSALSIVGRIYAGKTPVGTADPVEYACQQNFALLTTDGYWNTDAASDVKDIKGNAIGNLDGGTTPRPLFEGSPTIPASAGSLADTAKYYYDTDIRNNTGADATKNFGNCTGALGTDVCGDVNDHLQQNMVTLTLGLGIDGTLLYAEDYKDQNAGQGDFGNIKAGTLNWSNPMPAENGTRIDDLWHAAVNAGGTYYSAKNPKSLRESLVKGLSEIKSVFGAGSAAAATTLSPSNGDNFQFVASYRSVKWTGNIEARTVDLTTLKTNLDAVWCAESIEGEVCPAGTTLETGADANSNAFFCRTPSSNTTDCAGLGGTFDGITANCNVEIAKACDGTLPGRITATTDSRRILKNSGGALTEFSAASLSSAENTAFVNGYNSLSQYVDFSPAQQADTGKVTKLVNFIRGQQGNEMRSANLAADRLFRTREATLGDITQSKPAYLKMSNLNYTDAGYLAYKATGATRAATVFVGANDGMLHAFDAVNGQERWAFIPTPVVKNLPKLADRDYAINHSNYVNGDPYIADICVSGCSGAGASWKTILIAGLNGGGRGYYALDVTNPTAPSLMWEFTAANDSDLGYSFGVPVVTKLNSGKWVVLLTSGYNNGSFDNDGTTANAPAGNGGGYLYVRDVIDGSPISKISTGVGTSGTPSGLAKIAAVAANPNKNNLTSYVYGGDLQGNLWRFDINTATKQKIATLTGPSGAQPITTTPEVGIINKKRVIFVGTGKYLEPADLLTTQVQTVYAIKDDNLSAEITGLRSLLVSQTLVSGGNTRTVDDVPVNFSTGLGWFLDFPAGERVNIDPLLVNTVLLMPTTVPSSTSCLGGGFGWFNYFNYKTGGSPNIPGDFVSEKLNTPAVGFNLTYKDGKPVVSVVESNDPTPHQLKEKGVAAQSGTVRSTVFEKYPDGTSGKRSIWRELIKP
jgi:type IV pilus assembly protein PilY1